jgi:two-component system, NarL family, invasion response regulator UvrY
MRFIAAGQTVSEVASELHLSIKTVSTYRTRILAKLGLKNNAALMRYALLNGLIE